MNSTQRSADELKELVMKQLTKWADDHARATVSREAFGKIAEKVAREWFLKESLKRIYPVTQKQVHDLIK